LVVMEDMVHIWLGRCIEHVVFDVFLFCHCIDGVFHLGTNCIEDIYNLNMNLRTKYVLLLVFLTIHEPNAVYRAPGPLAMSNTM